MFSKEGLMDKKQRKNGFPKGKTKRKTRKENGIGRKEGFQRQAFRGNTIKKNSKIAGNNLCGPFYKTQAQNHRGNKTTQKKNRPKNTFLHFGKQPLIFGKFLFFKLHSFMSAKLCFAENTIKIVLSAEHSFEGLTDSKARF